MNEALAFHLLNRLPGCGAKTIRFLVGGFGSAEQAWLAPDEAWQKLSSQTRFLDIARARTQVDIEKETGLLQACGIQVIPFTDPTFPALLSEIADPPALLYVRGSFRAWNTHPLIAIVGSRKFTSYGKQVAIELSRALSRAGAIVVSGLAFGIDAIAHETALETGSPTLAILGSGIDDRTISPQSHLDLAQRLMANGALISELAPGTPANVGTFPARNRIMAGMSLGTIVVEAAEGSGSLITARLALDYNREVFAVPGSIFSPASTGTNALIKSGAKVVTGVQDILETFAHEIGRWNPGGEKEVLPELSENEAKIFAMLSQEAMHIDNLITAVRLEATQVSMILTRFELRGLAKNIGNMHYIRVR